jgi:hypothetical protein
MCDDKQNQNENTQTDDDESLNDQLDSQWESEIDDSSEEMRKIISDND